MHIIATLINVQKELQLSYLKQNNITHMEDKKQIKRNIYISKKSHMRTQIKYKNIHESENIYKRENHICKTI